MAKKTVCDVCENEIPDGQNVGLRNPIFNAYFPRIDADNIQVEIKITARVDGKTDSDLCVPCLKRAVAEA